MVSKSQPWTLKIGEHARQRQQLVQRHWGSHRLDGFREPRDPGCLGGSGRAEREEGKREPVRELWFAVSHRRLHKRNTRPSSERQKELSGASRFSIQPGSSSSQSPVKKGFSPISWTRTRRLRQVACPRSHGQAEAQGFSPVSSRQRCQGP